jgi:hypothetical protein
MQEPEATTCSILSVFRVTGCRVIEKRLFDRPDLLLKTHLTGKEECGILCGLSTHTNNHQSVRLMGAPVARLPEEAD